MNITLVYRYTWSGQEREILVEFNSGVVTCSDPDDGSSLGVYTWVAGALVGAGSLSQTRRDAIAALISSTLTALT